MSNITTFAEYQAAARSTAIYPRPSIADPPNCLNIDVGDLLYPALGLASEAGEFAGNVKKIMRDKDGSVSMEDRDALIKELGDTLWYCAALATELNVPLGEVARRNIAKLEARKAAGTLQGSGDNR